MASGRANRSWGAALAGGLLVIASCGSRPLYPIDGVLGSGGSAGAGAGGVGGGLGSGGTPTGVGGSPGSAGGFPGGAGGAPGSAGGAGGSSVAGSPAAPRLIAPLSTATVTSQRPTLRWVLAAGTDGAHVDICRDRACTKTVTSFDVVGPFAAPRSALPSGVLFWRAFGRSAGAIGTTPSPTWEMFVGARSATVDTSWGTTPDVNGDGA